MKKILAVVVVVAVGLLLGGMAYAAWSGGFGPRSDNQVDLKTLRSFQQETLLFRDEMIAKRTEIWNEYAKEKPDQNRIAALQKEMTELRTKIQGAAQKHGLSDWGSGRMGRGGYGMGHGGGCGVCPMR